MNRLPLSVTTILLVFVCTITEVNAAEEMTRLRSGAPQGTFETYKGVTRLTQIKVVVKNVGEVAAKQVVVQVALSNGDLVAVGGPREIQPKEEAVYKTYPYEYVTSSKRLKAKLSCENCYK